MQPCGEFTGAYQRKADEGPEFLLCADVKDLALHWCVCHLEVLRCRNEVGHILHQD